MENTGCRIKLDFERPPKELVEQFRGIPVANIDDCMNRLAAVDQGIRQINRCALLGVALTVKVPAGDNLMLHKAMDLAKPGDVLVVEAGETRNRAIIGELMSTYCKVRGIAGLVVDGPVRDYDALSEMEGFAVYARGASPNGPYKNGPGEINFPVTVGGQIVYPGDIVYGDADGVIIIRPDEAESLLKQAHAVEEKEAAIMKGILEGNYPRPWVDAKLKEIGCLTVE